MQPQAQVPQSYIIEGYLSLSLVIYIAKQTKQHYNRRGHKKGGSYTHIRRDTFKEVKPQHLFFSLFINTFKAL